jgi:adenosylhomocysteine nucleosidase
MESAAVAEVCGERGLPYVGVRCITDLLNEDLPIDFNRCRGSDGGINTGRVIAALAMRPFAIPGVLRLQRRAADCSRILLEGVTFFLTKVTAPGGISGHS